MAAILIIAVVAVIAGINFWHDFAGSGWRVSTKSQVAKPPKAD